jgi:hypothetical protein
MGASVRERRVYTEPARLRTDDHSELSAFGAYAADTRSDARHLRAAWIATYWVMAADAVCHGRLAV